MLKSVIRMSIHSWLRDGFGGLLGVCGMAGFLAMNAIAETKPAPQITTVDMVMLSDLHLDPFHDPAKVPQLVRAPLRSGRRFCALRIRPLRRRTLRRFRRRARRSN